MISDNIKRLRENAGLSQSALARKLGVTRASVNAWEMELSAPTAQYLVALAQLFHTTTDDILGLESEEQIVLRDMNEQEKRLVYDLVSYIAIEIILNMLIGKSSNLYNELYKEGYLLSQPDLEYEFGNEYSHVLIGGQSKNPQKVYEKIAEKIQEMKNNDINVREFERIKKKIYGDYAVEYNNVADIGRMFTSDYIKGINIRST